jgi:hypothetical protein
MKLNIQDSTEVIYDKLLNTLPYDDDQNALVADSIREHLLEHPNKIPDFIENFELGNF